LSHRLDCSSHDIDYASFNAIKENSREPDESSHVFLTSKDVKNMLKYRGFTDLPFTAAELLKWWEQNY